MITAIAPKIRILSIRMMLLGCRLCLSASARLTEPGNMFLKWTIINHINKEKARDRGGAGRASGAPFRDRLDLSVVKSRPPSTDASI